MRSELDNNGTLVLGRSRIVDFVTLTKPELTFLSVITALGGYYLGAGEHFHLPTLAHVLLGTLLLGGGVGALNQFIERDFDALMRRTENRPLPSGRMTPGEALLFGVALSLGGLLDLFLFANYLTGLLAFLTFVTYLFAYTPLKRVTWLSTIVGGVPGALPPLIGFAAARNEITLEGWTLFGILFCWQMPHFFSLAWMYRRDYQRAGYPMLPVLDSDGTRTARHIVGWCVSVIPVSLLLVESAGLGMIYAGGALLAGGVYLIYAIALVRTRSNQAARKVFVFSLLYLPILLGFMLVDRI